MQTQAKTSVTIKASIKAPVEKVWKHWTEPASIVQWNNASPDWHTPKAVNDVRTGGKFVFTMAAKDGSMSFDFSGIYTEVMPNKVIAYTMEDGRKARVEFSSTGSETHILETFDAETENPVEMQRAGWQAILDSFKKFVEAN